MLSRHRPWARRLILGAIIILGSVSLLGTVSLLMGAPGTILAQEVTLARAVHVESGYPARPAGNRIVSENALPGTDEWKDIGNYDINRLAAFAGATSVQAGDAITIHVQSVKPALSWRLYRLGYYQDHGARLVVTSPTTSATTPQPACTRNSSTGLVRCPWAAAFALPTEASWISGIYLLRLDSSGGAGANNRFFVYFVVRNDSYPAAILVQEATKTNQAYNDYGGESLYVSRNNEGRTRAYEVSFDRPYATGAGTGDKFFAHAVDAVRWLEASGYDVSYIRVCK